MPPETDTTSAPGLPAREALYTAEDIAMMSPAEQDHARRVNAEHIAGGDPFGELTEAQAAEAAAAALALGQQPPAEAPAPADTPVAAPAAAAPAPAEAPAEAPAPAAAMPTPAPAPQPTQILQPVGDAAKLTERRTAIADEVAAIEQKWADGEIDTAEMRRLKAPLAQESDDLLMKLTSHQTLAMAQQQMAAAQFQQQIAALKVSALQQGLDYNDQRLAKQFDQALDVLEADPDMATKSPADLIAEAHAIVMARNPGQRAATPSPSPAPAAATPAAAPAPARMQPPAPPTTLRTLTSAERPMDGAEGLGQRFTGTNAIEREKLWDQMTPAQRKALLDD